MKNSKSRPTINPIKTGAVSFCNALGQAEALATITSPRPGGLLGGYGRPVPLHPDIQHEQFRLYEQAFLNRFEARSATSPRAGLPSPLPFSADSLANLRPLSASSIDVARQQGRTEHGLIPDAFVAPLDLQALAETLEGLHSPPASPSDSHTIRAIVHSGDRHRLLTRHFNLETLRGTIPSGTVPRSPAVDRKFSLQFIERPDLVLPPASPYRLEHELQSGQPSASRSGRRYLPVDKRSARAHLPALAALMMSGEVKFGDQVELPIPHPDAWLDTLLYIYTRDDSFLKEAVKQNILYLGGMAE